MDSKKQNFQNLKIGILSKLLSDFIKYSISAINLIDALYVRSFACDIEYSAEVIIRITELSEIANNNSFSNYALAKVLQNEWAFEIFLNILTVKNLEDYQLRENEINLLSEILIKS